MQAEKNQEALLEKAKAEKNACNLSKIKIW